MSTDTMTHLQAHHGDFAAFRDAMIDTSVGRFGPIWWGVLAQHVPDMSTAAVVDLGTGPGVLLEQLHARHPSARLTGVEIQPLMLEAARWRAVACGAEIIEADLGGSLPIPSDSADVVTAVMVFHELQFPPALLDEVCRMLKPGGTLVFYDWVKRPLADYLRGQSLTPDLLQHFREHCLFSTDDVVYLMAQQGLEIVEVVGRRGGNFAIVVARKPEASAG